jgi:chorismate mutase
MSKKLLSEAQVRRFQSLASIQPLQEMGHKYEEAEMEEMVHANEAEMEEGSYMEEKPYMEAEEPEMDMGADEPEMDADMDDEGGDSDVELDEELVERFMDAAKAVQEMADALGGSAGEMDMGDEEPMDDMPADEPEMDMGADAPAEEPAEEEGEELLELALEGIEYEASQKEIVEEVAKRVAKRIMEAKKAHIKMNKALGK